ncbi:MAG: HAD family hydrolase [Kiloniellaceae bacterium]
MIQGILFDKDGTLLDYYSMWLPLNRRAALDVAGGDAAAAERLMQAAGYDPASDTFAGNSIIASASNDELAACWLAELGGDGDAADFTRRITAVFEAGSAEAASPVPGLAETLRRLKARGLMLGVATNDSEDSALSSLGRFEVLDHFAFLAGFDSGHGAKPGPGMVEGFCKVTGLAPEAVAVIGDNHHDMEMGRRAGAGLLVGVLTGTGKHDDLAPHAHHVLDSIAELEALLDEVAGRLRA